MVRASPHSVVIVHQPTLSRRLVVALEEHFGPAYPTPCVVNSESTSTSAHRQIERLRRSAWRTERALENPLYAWRAKCRSHFSRSVNIPEHARVPATAPERRLEDAWSGDSARPYREGRQAESGQQIIPVGGHEAPG